MLCQARCGRHPVTRAPIDEMSFGERCLCCAFELEAQARERRG